MRTIPKHFKNSERRLASWPLKRRNRHLMLMFLQYLKIQLSVIKNITKLEEKETHKS